MRKIKPPNSIKIQGFEYRFLEFSHGVAIYGQHEEEGGKVHPEPSNFEVFLVGTFFRFPKDEDFGVTAWTYPTLELAMAKKRALTAPVGVRKMG